jgi:hypothetical protein
MDKFDRAIIASLIGSTVKDIPTFISHIIWDIPKIAYWDYAARIGFGNLPKTFVHYLFAIPLEITFGITLGVGLLYLMEALKLKHHIVFGIGIGSSIWFFLRIFVALYNFEPFVNPDEISAIVNWVMSIIYCITTILIYNWLKKKDDSNRIS